MSNNGVIIALGGLIGGLVGFFVGELILDKLYEREYALEDEYVDEEYNDVEDKYEDPPNKEDQVKKEHVNIIEKKKYVSKPYDKYFDEKKGDIGQLEKMANIVRKETLSNHQIISQDEYDESNEKAVLYAYSDGMVTTDQDRLLGDDEVDMFIGPEALKSFGVRSGDPDIVYIRNGFLKKDFEVIKKPLKFSDEVGEPIKKKVRKNAKNGGTE